jgi:hypothetical protein
MMESGWQQSTSRKFASCFFDIEGKLIGIGWMDGWSNDWWLILEAIQENVHAKFACFSLWYYGPFIQQC